MKIVASLRRPDGTFYEASMKHIRIASGDNEHQLRRECLAFFGRQAGKLEYFNNEDLYGEPYKVEYFNVR